MRLKESRVDAQLAQTDVVPLLKAVEPRADVSLLSKYENGICIPTPGQFKVLCDAYKREPSDLYNPDEVHYGIRAKGKGEDRHRAACFRLFARIPLDLIGSAVHFKAMLTACGYVNATAWVCQCVKRLSAEYTARQKRTSRQDGATSRAAQ